MAALGNGIDGLDASVTFAAELQETILCSALSFISPTKCTIVDYTGLFHTISVF
jgi:hypothetical protein